MNKRRRKPRPSESTKTAPDGMGRRRTLLLSALAAGAVMLGLVWWSPMPAIMRSLSSSDAGSIDLPQVDAAAQDDPAVGAAIDEATVAVRRERASPSAWGRLGMTLAVHGFPSQAASCLEVAGRLDPHDPRWPYLRGSSYCRADLPLAIDLVRRAVELWPKPPLSARLRYAELLLQDNQLNSAQEQIRLALADEPASAPAHLLAARWARENQDWPAALAHLSRARDDRHTRKAAARLSAEVRLRSGDSTSDEHDQAVLRDFRADDPWPDPVVDEAAALQRGRMARLTAADALLTTKRYAKAAAAYRELVRDYPELTWPRVALGRALMEQKDLVGAESALRAAVEREPGSADAQFQLGTVLLLQKQLAPAADHLRAATVSNPQDPMSWHNLAHALLGQQDAAGAEQAFRQALACKPNLAEARLDLGKLLLEQDRRDEALAQLKYAQRLRPDDLRPTKIIEQDRAGRP